MIRSKLIFVFLVLQALQPCISAWLTWVSYPSPIVAGKRNRLSYQGSDITQPVTIILLRGHGKYQTYIETITTNATGGNYTWTPSTTLVNGIDYSLDVEQGGGGQQLQCEITGGKPLDTTSTSQPSKPTNGVPTDQPNSQKPSPQGITSNVAIGIGVGIAVLIIALAAILAFVFWRLKSKKKRKFEKENTHNYNSSVDFMVNPNEAGSALVYEKASRVARGELGTGTNTFEMGGWSRNTRHELG